MSNKISKAYIFEMIELNDPPTVSDHLNHSVCLDYIRQGFHKQYTELRHPLSSIVLGYGGAVS